MPFTDPMADGPAIQNAGQRALDGGQTLDRRSTMVRAFRDADTDDAAGADGLLQPDPFPRRRVVPRRGRIGGGIDGLIIVDLPPEEDEELCLPAQAAGLDSSAWRRRPPTTAACRGCYEHLGLRLLRLDHRHHRRAAANADDRSRARGRPDQGQDALPVASASASRRRKRPRAIARVADGAVVGSAIVERIGRGDPPARYSPSSPASPPGVHHRVVGRSPHAPDGPELRAAYGAVGPRLD